VKYSDLDPGDVLQNHDGNLWAMIRKEGRLAWWMNLETGETSRTTVDRNLNRGSVVFKNGEMLVEPG